VSGCAAPGWLLVVSAALNEEADLEAFNAWYDRVHLPEITACPGFHDAVRYAAGADADRRFLALYSIDGPEAIESEAFAARRGFGPFTPYVTFTTTVYSRLPAPTRVPT
jgi:hypothetical protein